MAKILKPVSEPVRLAEIDRRVQAMTPQGRALLRQVLAEDVPWIDVGAIQQILPRYHDLSDAGQAWVGALVVGASEEGA